MTRTTVTISNEDEESDETVQEIEFICKKMNEHAGTTNQFLIKVASVRLL